MHGNGGHESAATAGTIPFTAMVLAGGLGTRLRPVLTDRPKCLAPVLGEPFVGRLLDQLVRAGCRRTILCTGHLGEQVERELGTSHDGMELVYSREAEPLGTAGALANALPLVATDDDAVLVLNGDSYVDVDLAAFVADARRRDGTTLLAVDVDDTGRFGALELDANGAVRAFAEKRTGGGAGCVNAGIYWLPVRELAALDRRPTSLERDVLPALVGHGLGALRTEAPFLDIGTPESFAQCEAFFAACELRRRRDRKGLLVVDRDGTLIVERNYLADPDGVELLPGVVDGLRAFAERGYDIAVVTNQSGIARGYFDEPTLDAIHDELRRQLRVAGIELQGIWHCPHHPEHGCGCRKPEPDLLERAMDTLGHERRDCLVVGDKACDIELGTRLGVRTALVRTGYGAGTERDGLCAPDVVVDSLADLAALEVRP